MNKDNNDHKHCLVLRVGHFCCAEEGASPPPLCDKEETTRLDQILNSNNTLLHCYTYLRMQQKVSTPTHLIRILIQYCTSLIHVQYMKD